ncbi:phosphotransferase family protein [Roseospira navarrensis]|uniref:Aminoglycoside phosphotransferase domain-containing protein n=1 Tax=Roseospira navarrensis TaxID=140058 RepID=A0A7X1ZDI7_9PROT|nr:hypothetical protein [Roseospira navarrensis]MQX36568.1 hypothetical protein [Roseospira navarrensis]
MTGSAAPDDRTAALTDLLLARVEALRGLDPAALTVTPHLSAATGPDCTVSVAGAEEPLAVRLPPEWTAGRSRRRPIGLVPLGGPDDPAGPPREGTNLARGAPLGLAPPTLQFDPADGLWVRPAWPGATVDANALHADPGVLTRFARSLRRLHRSGVVFEGDGDPFTALDLDTDWTRDTAVGMPLGTLRMVTDITGQCRDALAADPVEPVPCLNAQATEACVDTGSRVVFVDWRSSCMGDPAFELAGLAARAGLNAEEVVAFLTAYFGTADQTVARDRAVAFRLIAAYLRLMDLHGALMAGLADPASDIHQRRFKGRLESCLMILESKSWTGAMDRLSARRRLQPRGLRRRAAPAES